jgi:hypothetical protein
MVDILVRNIDEAAAAQLKKNAKSAGKSLNDFARWSVAHGRKAEKRCSLDRGRPHRKENRKSIRRFHGDHSRVAR